MALLPRSPDLRSRREECPLEAADRWREVHDSYVERFGPEASAIGPPEEWERVHGPDTGTT